MAEYVLANNGLPIFDTTRAAITLNSVGQPVDHMINVATITTANRFPNYGVSPPISIPQPSMEITFVALVYFVIYQVVSTPQVPTTTQSLRVSLVP